MRVENCATCRFFSPKSAVRLRSSAELAAFGSGALGMDREEKIDACAAHPTLVPAPGWCGEWKAYLPLVCGDPFIRPGSDRAWALCLLLPDHEGKHTNGYDIWPKEQPDAKAHD